MRVRSLTIRLASGLLAISVSVWVFPAHQPVFAAPPVVRLDPAGVRVTVDDAPLSDAIDALARTAGFKVTYDGPKPTAMLFKTEIGTPTVAEALFRLLDGQNLNYGVVFDRTGKEVTLLMMLGPASKGSAPAAPPAGPNARPFPPPGNPRNAPLLDEEPDDVEPPEPEPVTPEPGSEESPPPPATEEPAPEGQPVALPPSPFAPRPLVVSPFAPRFQPPPSPSPSP